MKHAIVLLLLAACSKGEDKSKDVAPAPKPTEAAAASERAKPTRVVLPIDAFVELDTKRLGFKPQVVLGKQPAELAKELAQYVHKDKPRKGGAISDAIQAEGDKMMADFEKEVAALGVDTKRARSEVEFRLPATPASRGDETHVILHTNDDGSVREYGVWYETTPEEQQALVAAYDKLWGPHKIVNETLGPRTTWFAPDAGVRASTRVEKPDRLDVDYVRYLPLAKFFGEPGPVWGFETQLPLLGATVEQLVAAYGEKAIEVDRAAGTATLSLPPTDYAGDTAQTTILMFLTGGKVRQWNTSLPFEDYEPSRAEYAAALDAKFGKPKPARHEHLIYGKRPKVDVRYSKYTHELDIEVSR